MSSLVYKPTRMELIGMRRRLKLARRAHDLLREKQDALMMEFLSIIQKYLDLRKQVDLLLQKTFKSIIKAKMSLGIKNFYEVIYSSNSNVEAKIKLRNIMGVYTPVIELIKSQPKQISYSIHYSSPAFDEAFSLANDTLLAILKMAEAESTLKALAEEIKSVKRRVNALEYVVIPRIERIIKNIEQYLSEREREDIFRIKRLISVRSKSITT
ncbi:MAG: V-type ATP synthase subunit D [Candidatus Methanomethylicia archaeon]